MLDEIFQTWQKLIAWDDKKMDGSLPPYPSEESRERILTLIDKLENAIAWFAPDGTME
jgi:hypothetical protein